MVARAVFASLLITAFLPASSDAQLVRTWVSTTGTENPSCSRPAPCRTFGAAIAAVDAGGEVVVLDSGGYGAFVVTKSVTVKAPPGIHAAIAPTSGIAIEIAAGASDLVRLVNLHAQARGAATGIRFTSGGRLVIEDCSLDGFPTNVDLSARAYTSMTRSVVLNAVEGLTVTPSSGTGALATVLISESRFENNAWGVLASADSRVFVEDSVASGGRCFSVSGFETTAELSIVRSTAAFCSHGFVSYQVSTLRLSDVSAVSNTIGVLVNSDFGAFAYSRGNNTIHGNLTDVTGTLTPFAPR